MLLRCKSCDTLIGVRPPFDDWSADREALCPACAKNQFTGAASAGLIVPKDKAKDGDGDGQK